jgi:hypothetical protein
VTRDFAEKGPGPAVSQQGDRQVLIRSDSRRAALVVRDWAASIEGAMDPAGAALARQQSAGQENEADTTTRRHPTDDR